MAKPSTRNKPKDHFISPVAHYYEEAIVNLHAITHYHKGEIPKAERDIIFKLKRHLATLHRRETKRRRDQDVQD